MDLQPLLRVPYKTINGSVIHTDVYLPARKSSNAPTKYPTILAIHGGAFMLGHSRMVNPDQISDMLERGWIVLSLDHRLCPQVTILEGPMADCRDALQWVREGKLDQVLDASQLGRGFRVDQERVGAFGTSSGGTLALGLAYGVPSPVAAVLDFYGAKDFGHAIWTTPLAHVPAPPVSEDFINRIFETSPVPTQGGVSLEGQGQLEPTEDPRTAFALTQMSRGTVLQTNMPSGDYKAIDACQNVSGSWPPTCIVHGTEDNTVPMYLSRHLESALQGKGIRVEFVEVPNAKHTFAGQMTKGSELWQIQRRGFEFLETVLGKGPGF